MRIILPTTGDPLDMLACEDCFLLICNGETGQGPEHDEAVAALQVAALGSGAMIGNLVPACEDGEREDGTTDHDAYGRTHHETITIPYRCDTCQRPMHGEFHAVAVLG